ncbi:hypothetical protein HDU76_000927 [Blyttiomyces sp. JEL0837]|nr:hypothetical protein HDU76_000927 [Blyttiomyces sp. JEL0837]
MLFRAVNILILAIAAAQAAHYYPPSGKRYICAWVQTDNKTDTPSAFNSRIKQNTPCFQLAQDIPLAISPFDNSELTVDLSQVQNTSTDAMLFMTVYPKQGLAAVDQSHIDMLATQLDNLSRPNSGSARRVMLRFGPEMNGNWFKYGQDPVNYVKTYKAIVDAVRAKTSRVAFVWSPNAGNNYPFGDIQSPSAAQAPLDTTKDGKVTNLDDPFGPYFPGQDYVDWIGISLYWKGNPNVGSPLSQNDLAPNGFVDLMINGFDLERVNPSYSLYRDYAQKYNIPMVISEGGAAFHLNLKTFDANGQITKTDALSPGPGQSALQQSFWKSYLTNTTFLNAFPLLQMFGLFEQVKLDEDPYTNPTTKITQGVDRDYRITVDPTTLQSLLSDLASVSSYYSWANSGFDFTKDPITYDNGGNGGSPSGTPTSATVSPTTTKSAAVKDLNVATAGGFLSVLVGLVASLLF